MSLTLYGSRGSGSAAIEMALHAVGLPFRSVRASSWEADSDQAALRAVNPLGQIPTLVLADGSVLTESAAILIHLGLCHPAAALLPAEPAARAQAIRGLVFIAANCYAAVSVSDYPERWTTQTSEAARAAVRRAARVQLHQAWSLFADAFGTQPDLLSPEVPGALAFLAVVVSQWSGARAHLQAQRPAFHALLQGLEAHPRLAAVLAEYRAG